MATKIVFEYTEKLTLKDKVAKIKEELAKELHKFGEEMMAISKTRVPVKWGILKGTGKVQDPVIDGSKITVVMGYGGPAVGYALVVHEDMTMRHKPGTGAKYLENPLKENQDQLPARLAAAVKRGLCK